MKTLRIASTAAALCALAIAVLGSWIRINGAGMTCPDWPLCRGALIPALHGGVVLEWSHRAFVMVESFLVIGVAVAAWRARSLVSGMLPLIAALFAIFAAQVLLGAATVHLSNNPPSVMLHWAMGMLLLAVLTGAAVVAWTADGSARAFPQSGKPIAATIGVAAGAGFLTMCVGAYVSSSFAGLACPGVPGCSPSFLGDTPAQWVQMLHRGAATAFSIAGVAATIVAARSSRRAAAASAVGVALIAVQVALGIANVVWHLPMVLREAHAANACLTFLAFVISASLAAVDGARATAPLRAGADDVARRPQTSMQPQ